MEEEKNSLKIGTQQINLDALKDMNQGELVKTLETIYFDGYQQ
jgi:hypothetical protein